ncbi:hypothetical protein PspLS_11046, partial [Pyricularia sp. CBS 133598]
PRQKNKRESSGLAGILNGQNLTERRKNLQIPCHCQADDDPTRHQPILSLNQVNMANINLVLRRTNNPTANRSQPKPECSSYIIPQDPMTIGLRVLQRSYQSTPNPGVTESPVSIPESRN